MQHRYLIALGSNRRHHRHGSPRAVLNAAIAALEAGGWRVEAQSLIADTACDSNAIIADLDARGAKAVISQHPPRRIKPLTIDAEMYKWRHLIENFFGKLKEFKRIALRACKTDTSFAAMIYIAATVINSR